MSRSLVIPIVAALLAALFAALYLFGLEARYRSSAVKVTVLTARQYIDQGALLAPEMLEERQVPKEYLQPKAVQQLKQLTNADGRLVFMAAAPLEQGEQIIATKLISLGADTGLAGIVPTDRRAATILLERAQVSGLVKPGNRTDVIAIFEYEDRDRRQQEGAFTLLQNVLVLAVGTDFLGGIRKTAPADGERARVDVSMERIPVSFALTPQEAALLLLAAEKGSVRLSLRPGGDQRILEVPGVRLSDATREIVAVRPAGVAPSSPSQVQRQMDKTQKEVLDLIRKYGSH